MRIDAISNLAAGVETLKTLSSGEVSGASFEEILSNTLKEINDLQIKADFLVEEMVLGNDVDIHQVMLATEQAKLALELTVQVRNKLVEAYQEIARMQF